MIYIKPIKFLVAVSDKIPEGSVPRYLEDEGFYVGKPSPVSLANLNMMENRILRETKEVEYAGNMVEYLK